MREDRFARADCGAVLRMGCASTGRANFTLLVEINTCLGEFRGVSCSFSLFLTPHLGGDKDMGVGVLIACGAASSRLVTLVDKDRERMQPRLSVDVNVFMYCVMNE